MLERLKLEIQTGSREALQKALTIARRKGDRGLECELVLPLLEALRQSRWGKQSEDPTWSHSLSNKLVGDILEAMYTHGKIEEDVLWVGTRAGTHRGTWEQFYRVLETHRSLLHVYHEDSNCNGLTNIVIVGHDWWIDLHSAYRSGWHPMFHQTPTHQPDPAPLDTFLEGVVAAFVRSEERAEKWDQLTPEEQTEDHELQREDYSAWKVKWFGEHTEDDWF